MPSSSRLLARDVPPPMPVVVGSPRSGTTLVRLLLDSHPELAIPPETGFLALARELAGPEAELRERVFAAVVGYPPDAPTWSDFGIAAEAFRARLAGIEPFDVAEGFRLFYRMYAERFGKARWGDKTPAYAHRLRDLEAVLPEARFVHVVRDGRDVAVSLRKQWFSPGHEIGIQAGHWRDFVAAARREGAGCRHFLEIRFEDLLRDPEAVTRRLCSFLELEYDPVMLAYPERAPRRLEEHGARYRTDGSLLVSREARARQQIHSTRPPDLSKIGTWRNELAPGEADRFFEIAGDWLVACGYEP